ncbi:hypothetical protein [Haloprofundus salilacus]|uniref:hypothetical protein n=1 Tax=Haloprofundus salilacus TaxID=2876190 RepID=UPI001CC96F28|nr:hypothetical protein [Haloprofundus salilacus]
MSSKSEKTRISKNTEGRDSIQSFIEENILDEKRVDRYKGYKIYGEWADLWFPRIGGLTVGGIFAVALFEHQYYGQDSNVIVEPFSYFAGSLFAAVILLGTISWLARLFSEISTEMVAYHELASAFKTYRSDPDSLEPVIERISTSLSFFDSHQFKRLDKKRFEDAEHYLSKVVEAGDPTYISDEFHQTFPLFMEEFSNSVASTSETTFSQLAKDMDTAYTGEKTMRGRLISDIKRATRFLFTGREIVITSSIMILGMSFFVDGLSLGTAFGISGSAIGIYSLYQNRD